MTGFDELLADEWRYQMSRNPVWASLLGQRAHDDRWDDVSLEAIEADHRHNREVLARLAAIDRESLPPASRLDYDLLRRDYARWVEGYQYRWHLLPISPMTGLPEGLREPPGVQYAYRLGENLGFDGPRDYEAWIARLRSFPVYVAQTTELMREGMRVGMVHPVVVVDRVIEQIAAQARLDGAASGFYTPFLAPGESVSGPQLRRLATEARSAIEDLVLPALERFRRFLQDEYRRSAPDEVGIWQWPGGSEAYAHFARVHTTTDLTPQQIHEIGLEQVALIRSEMERVRVRAGFEGTLAEFFAWLRDEPRFYAADPAVLLEEYRMLAASIDARLPAFFGHLPKLGYVVEATPEMLAASSTAGFYFPGAPDGSRPGKYIVNVWQPSIRPRWEMLALTLHEAVPGHHLQVSIAAELSGVSEFRRFQNHNAYAEGWALYSEWLGVEMGLYEDPYDDFGRLSFDIWRAMRLVIDTGIHVMRWSRQQAIDYFLANAPRHRDEVANEVDRYVAWPGQALSYKIGQLEFLRLRRRAECELGSGFDVRSFHDMLLGAGSLPLDVLEARVADWVAERMAD